jgi:protein TonB
MDLSSNLIESQKQKHKGGWKASLAALGVHGAIIGLVVFMTATASHKVTAEEKPIRAFMVNSAGAPPPPPPPPPPPAPAAASHPQPVQVVKPVLVPKTTFVQPTEIPKEVPKVPTASTAPVVDLTPAQSSSEPAGEPGGVAGGVAGGVVGGVEGGVVGGQTGGQVGGVLGGTPGGVVGGTLGGTGNGSGSGEPAPPSPPPAPEPIPEGPVRVGGNVKAPVIVKKVEPEYTEVARKGKIAGVVILEAIINKNGQLEDVRVLKPLPMGLSEKAVEAVKEWRFKPGTMNGEPVAVIFNLTINFTLN